MAGDFEGNPFADPEGINPFADPAVTQVTTEPQPPADEEYNPFAEETKRKEPEPPRLPPPPTKSEVKAKEKPKEKPKKVKKTKPSGQWPPPQDPSSPAVIQTEPDEPPAYSPAPSSFADNAETRKREEEIARREAALHEREQNLEKLGPRIMENNFPPFPKFCPAPCKPCIYLNISTQVPPVERWKMYTLLSLLIYTWVLLIINMFVSIFGAITIDGGRRGQYLTTMGVAILYLVIFMPGSLFCWFIPVYHAYRKDSSMAFMWFFFVMLFQILSYLLNAVGIPNLGACGFFNGAKFFDGSGNGGRHAGGAMFMIVGVLWIIAVPVATAMLFLVHRYYRSSGGSINRASQEAATAAAGNEYVRGAVRTGVEAGIKSQFQE